MSIISQFLAANSKDKLQTFTASGSFTVPDGVYTLFVTMCGGGGGRYEYSGGYKGGAGAGGYFEEYPLAVTPGDVLTITVGAGGTSKFFNGSANYGTNTNGGTTKISLGAADLLVAYGGSTGYYVVSGGVGIGTWTGGAGGYPNGAGGGSNGGGAGGCGLAKGSQVFGGGPNVANSGSQELWGTGILKGVGSASAQSAILGYGGGEQFNSGTTAQYTSGAIKGESGIVILKWIGA